MKRTLAILAIMTTVGCTIPIQPATPPDEELASVQINNTQSTTLLLDTLKNTYQDIQPEIVFNGIENNHETNLALLQNGDTTFVVTNHLSYSDSVTFWAAPLAQDGLAIITHADNPVSNLRIEQLRRIYRGYITNWQDVGGADLDITLLSRESGSGTRAEFERLVMGQQRTSPNAQVVASPAATLQRLIETPGAIAYLPLSQTTTGIRILAIDDVRPSFTTIGNNSYSLRYTIYIIGLSEPEGIYRNFIGWMQGAEGQNVIRSHYAPLP
ncbi:MAG: substrate-binding domain-containing protein [Anaerolineae bacterium]|nr:substrate-binding domain-containing protein [Anaerolineae bacterium]